MATRKWATPAAAKRAAQTKPLTKAERAQVDAAAVAALNALQRAGAATREPAADLEPAKNNTPSRWGAEMQRRQRIHHGQRARRLPIVATGAVAVGGTVAWGAAELAGHLAGPTGHAVATGSTTLLTATVLAGIRVAIRKRIGPWGRRFATASAAATAWVTLMAAGGPEWWLSGALVLAASALSAGWLRAHEVPMPDPKRGDGPPPPSAMLDSPERVGEFAARWDAKVTRNQRIGLSGCRLGDGQDNGNVLEYLLRLTGGKTLADVRDKQEAIAAALGMDPMQLTFDHTAPKPGGFRDTSEVAVQVILSSPITGPVYFTEPRFTLTTDGYGLLGLGPCVDGERIGQYELFRPDGMFSGVAIGSTGSGKSSVVNGAVVSARACRGLPLEDSVVQGVATLYMDPKGNSSPDLRRHASVPVIGLDKAALFTSCVEEMVIWLGKQASLDGKDSYTLDYRVAYLIVIDECDMLFGLKGMGDRWGNIAKTGRSYGVGLLLATQYGGMKAFGNSEILRSSIRAGNVILMRTESNTSDKLIAPDLPKSTTLPKTPGYLYLANTQEIPGAIRSEWLLSSGRRIPSGFPESLRGWNADTALAKYPDAPLCPVARRALAPLLDCGDQEEREQARAAVLRTELAAYLHGQNLGSPAQLLASAASSPSGFGGMFAKFAALPGPVTEAPPPKSRARGGNVVLLRPGTQTGGDDLSPNQQAVLQQLRAGVGRTGDIAARTAMSEPVVSKCLSVLAGKGRAVKRGNRWHPTTSAGVGT